MAFSRFNKKPSSSPVSSSVSLPIVILVLILRFAQLILGITVCGIYGKDIHTSPKEPKYKESSWVFAIVIGALSAVSALVYGALRGKDRGWAFGWDTVLFILWAAVFGVFGKLYIHYDNRDHNSGVKRMKDAAWIDLVNMLLWLLSAIVGLVLFFTRSRSSLHTGRATV